jgi:hypothetical protein
MEDFEALGRRTALFAKIVPEHPFDVNLEFTFCPSFWSSASLSESLKVRANYNHTVRELDLTVIASVIGMVVD